MKRTMVIAVMLMLAASDAEAGKGSSRYLTKDNQLTYPLELRDVQGGFAGFTGFFWKLAKNGDWKKYQVFNEKLTFKDEGKLTKEQLNILARELDKNGLHDLLGRKKLGKVQTNPRVVTIQFGGEKLELTLGPGEPLSRPTPGEIPSAEQRFGAIVLAVQEAAKAKPAEPK